MANKSIIERIYSSRLEEKVRPGKVLILYGPRQVGKTTLVRQYLKGFKGRYYATTGEDLHTIQVLTSFSQDEIRRHYGDLDLLFIDEAQAIPQVGRTLKFLVDVLPELELYSLLKNQRQQLISIRAFQQMRILIRHHTVYGLKALRKVRLLMLYLRLSILRQSGVQRDLRVLIILELKNDRVSLGTTYTKEFL